MKLYMANISSSTVAAEAKIHLTPLEVTTSDFRRNINKYLKLIGTRDIFIIKNKRAVAKLSNPQNSAVADFHRTLDELHSLMSEPDPIWSRAAAAIFFNLPETDITDELLYKYYQAIEDRARDERYCMPATAKTSFEQDHQEAQHAHSARH